ncbi:MAG: DUF5682 family protein [Actinobacteria bacterium]|nr:DUF5682 family protein [Actinomycetota bacterium]
MTDPVAAPPVRVLGVRHHGPGSARAVERALTDYAPDCVLIEGPADADPLLAWVADPDLVPPVAILAWDTTDPGRSSFWPMAAFSPEWQALTWAARAGVPVRFIDLPSTLSLAAEEPVVTEPDGDADPAPVPGDDPTTTAPAPETAAEEPAEPPVRTDPIARLAAAAGFDDPEAWWDDAVELRSAGDPFDALLEAMGELRALTPEDDPETQRREAHMRQQLRAATKAGHQRIAVVCGAWHAPALAGKLPPATADAKLLAGAKKAKTELTWVPWTHSRLAFASGYGAGVASPGWYAHLFRTDDAPVARWFSGVAAVLREHDLPVSTAGVIEAVRLAGALAALRGRPVPGLSEVTEATWSVLCDGNPVLLELVTREAVVGESMGEVPDGVPTVPLDTDLRTRARALRLKFEAAEKVLTLDLRKPGDLAKSRFLRQLGILAIPWAVPAEARSTGTFKEVWTLEWKPEFAVRIIDAARRGNTVASAATAAILEDTTGLATVTSAVERALLAGLDDALPPLLAVLDERAAHEADITRLLDAVPPLARVQRYGDVRGTDTTRLADVARAVLERGCAGLPAAASGLSDDAAAELRRAIDAVAASISLLDPDTRELWTLSLLECADRRDVPGTIAGRLVRLLTDGGRIDHDEAAGRLWRVLSRATEPAGQANWVEGFLGGNPMLLIHDHQVLRILDEWVVGINPEAFGDVLPSLRRTFGGWPEAARRQLASAISGLDRSGTASASEAEDFSDVADLLAVVAMILREGSR